MKLILPLNCYQQSAKALAFFLLCICFNPILAQDLSADTIYLNGKIYTLNPLQPNATALSIRNGSILEVGSDKQVCKSRSSQTKVIDLHGKTLMPGFIEAHAHLSSMGYATQRINLSETKSEQEAAAIIKKAAAGLAPSEWILATGWDQSDWHRKDLPNNELISKAAPENPALLRRSDGHTILVNKYALKISGIDRSTQAPAGGAILKDSEGNPTGILLDNARAQVEAHVPQPSDEQLSAALKAGIAQSVAYGITTLDDAATSFRAYDILKKWAQKRELPIRIYAMFSKLNMDGPPLPNDAVDEVLARMTPEIGLSDGYLTARTVKLFADGTMGSRGAALLEPYHDQVGTTGFNREEEDRMFEVTARALARGYQVATHAIGDRACNITLNAYSRALQKYPRSDPRLRVEHAQVIRHADILRMKNIGAIASIQPADLAADLPWLEDRLGTERAATEAFRWKDLKSAGVQMAGGSDAPYGTPGPLKGIYVAVTRQNEKGLPGGGWQSNQCLSRLDAVRLFTIDAAFANFEEKVKGTLESGKYADFIVLSRDIFSCTPADLLRTNVELTVVGGKTVFASSRYAREHRSEG